MLYPNRLQAALLLDRRIHDLEAIMRDFVRIEGMRSSVSFHLSENNPGLFYRLFDATEELMLTFEKLDRPADMGCFRAALASPYTGILTPDIRERLAVYEGLTRHVNEVVPNRVPAARARRVAATGRWKCVAKISASTRCSISSSISAGTSSQPIQSCRSVSAGSCWARR